MILLPAYGRKYDSKERVLLDWHNGKDFMVRSGGYYCSIRDYESMKKDFDIIDLVYFSDGEMKTVRVWEHPLAGLTTYI